ncbi:MAG: hypothetical protein K2M81_02315 [Lachnospiraceae bacterium]|nr:hypothetical protein [Lachnospiraceae bacterium]
MNRVISAGILAGLLGAIYMYVFHFPENIEFEKSYPSSGKIESVCYDLMEAVPTACVQANYAEKQSKQNDYFFHSDKTYLKANAEYFDRITSEYKEEVIYAEVYLVKEYEQGSVYRLAIEPTVGLEYERLNQYFYVTEDKIYRLWPSYYSEDRQEVIRFYDDALFTAFLNTDEKLIEEGKIVCQSEELESSQEEKEERICYSISKNNDQITYSYQELKVNGETNYSENYVWEEGKGLTMYTSGCGGALKDILYMTEISVVSEAEKLYSESPDAEDMKSFLNIAEAAIENNELPGFLFSPEEKAICIYEGEKAFEISAHVFAIYKETAQNDIVFENMLYIEHGTGNLYTWEGEELVPMGMFYDKEATLSDFTIHEEETDFGEERIDIIDGEMDAVMEILLQAGNEDIKLIYDGIDRFAGREYLVVSSYEENDEKIHRTASYYIDRNSGNIYRKEENNDSLRDELHYIGTHKIIEGYFSYIDQRDALRG